MPIILLDALRETELVDAVEARLRPAIPDLVRDKRVDEVAAGARAANRRAFVLLIMPPPPTEYFVRAMNMVTRHRADLYFVLLGGEISAGQYKQLIQFGNADWVAEPAEAAEILDIVAAQRARQPARALPGKRPLAVSLLPSCGGVGNSTLAIEIAFQLAKRATQKNAPVCLFDLDFHTSHVCDYLDIEPRFDVKEVVGASHRLDAQLLEALASRHSSGLEVYAAPRDITRGLELSVEDLSTVLDLVAQRCGAIVIDLPVGRHSWTGPVLAASQGIIVTGRNTIPGLRQVSEALAAARRQAPQSEVRPAINKCDFGLLGGMARADHVARVLGEEKPFIVRRTHQALDCVNAGTPIGFADPSTKFVKDISAIVDFCLGLKVPPAANPSS